MRVGGETLTASHTFYFAINNNTNLMYKINEEQHLCIYVFEKLNTILLVSYLFSRQFDIIIRRGICVVRITNKSIFE